MSKVFVFVDKRVDYVDKGANCVEKVLISWIKPKLNPPEAFRRIVFLFKFTFIRPNTIMV